MKGAVRVSRVGGDGKEEKSADTHVDAASRAQSLGVGAAGRREKEPVISILSSWQPKGAPWGFQALLWGRYVK